MLECFRMSYPIPETFRSRDSYPESGMNHLKFNKKLIKPVIARAVIDGFHF